MEEQTVPKINNAIVGFLDILGFKNKLDSVHTNEDLTRLYADMCTVHKLFEKDPESDMTRMAHAVSLKKIISLSDALVVSIDLSSELVQSNGVIDTILGELYDLAFNQAMCVTKGYFLRGGIAKGFYFRDNSGDVLISNAMARAYETETKTYYPVIALDDRFHKFLMNYKEPTGYSAKDTDSSSIIKTTTLPAEKGSLPIYYLDYFSVAVGLLDDWYCTADLKAYKDERDEAKKTLIMYESHHKSQLQFVKEHREIIQLELVKSHDPIKVMPKYLWLKDYHNKSVEDHGFEEDYKI